MPNWIIYNNRLVYPNYVDPTFPPAPYLFSLDCTFLRRQFTQAGRKIISARSTIFPDSVIDCLTSRSFFSFRADEKRAFTRGKGGRFGGRARPIRKAWNRPANRRKIKRGEREEKDKGKR